MCGIAGYWGSFDPSLLARMNNAIVHRGPDDEGIFYESTIGIGLAHRRLSIIDISKAGHQPMTDANGYATIVFNGEIYNYRELRAELEANGVIFRGRSDTEVLLQLYLRHGEGILSRLNGIFAFGIWDARTRKLFVARDGLGVKPLYYAETPIGFLFSSELKSLLKEPSLPHELDVHAIACYLTYLWCPSPNTMLKGVHKLEPGTAMLVHDGSIKHRWRFYDLPNGSGKEVMSAEKAIQAVRSAVGLAVERQMVADVPVGAFLSGGLDSSAVVAFARRYAKERLQCFTIALEGGGADVEGMMDDLPYARRVAAHLGVDLHTVRVGPEIVDHLEEMIYHLDEPQADPAPLNAMFICKLAHEHGIKVMLSGLEAMTFLRGIGDISPCNRNGTGRGCLAACGRASEIWLVAFP